MLSQTRDKIFEQLKKRNAREKGSYDEILTQSKEFMSDNKKFRISFPVVKLFSTAFYKYYINSRKIMLLYCTWMLVD